MQDWLIGAWNELSAAQETAGEYVAHCAQEVLQGIILEREEATARVQE